MRMAARTWATLPKMYWNGMPGGYLVHARMMIDCDSTNESNGSGSGEGQIATDSQCIPPSTLANSSCGVIVQSIILPANSTMARFIVQGYATFFNITIAAFTSLGTGPTSKVLQVRTPETVPSNSPENVSMVFLNSSALHITWHCVNLSFVNGYPQKYIIKITLLTANITGVQSLRRRSVSPTMLYSVPATQTFAIITGLDYSSTYGISVAIVNSAGIGPFSLPILANTTVLLRTTTLPPSTTFSTSSVVTTAGERENY